MNITTQFRYTPSPVPRSDHYSGVDYDLSPHLTLSTRLLPRPRLDDRGLFSGYNIILGLRDDNEKQMPETIRVRWEG